MAIRMVEDDPQGNENKRQRSSSSSSSSGGGMLGGGLGNIVGLILPYLLKKPKLLLVLIAVAVLGYFFLGKGCSGPITDSVSNLFQTGGDFNKEAYDATEIYEPLADNIKNPLPEKVSLEEFAPKRLNQGQQGSCVAWASAYAARTILEARRTGKDPNSVRFSPSFMYNQISIDHNTCQGSYIKLAMDNMMGQGAVPFNDFKYDDSDCNREPSSQLKAQAQAYKIKGFQRLTEDGGNPIKEMLSIKQNLAQGSPVIIGMMVGGTFMGEMRGQDVWFPTNGDYSKSGFGGHAMCIIGYDDYKEGGAFRIMNSWGEDWGDKGFFWIRYSDFREFNVESYGLYPMGNAKAKKETVFKGDFGIVLNNGKELPIQRRSANYFECTQKITKNDKFKVQLTNNIECYIYIFGEETDGSSYVLFPYTKKHSPYCGITGTRLFPRDYSMQSDELGNSESIGVVITKEPIDYNAMNEKISKAQGDDYAGKIKNAIGDVNQTNAQFSGASTVNFASEIEDGKVVSFVIGFKK